MKTTSYNLYDFLASCEGNWRNAIFITCFPCGHPCKNNRHGCLMTADHSGCIRVVSVSRFEAATGQKIDPSECVGTLSRGAFETAFRAYLLWKVDAPEKCPLRQLDSEVNF